MTSAFEKSAKGGNPYVFRLRPARIIINCAVIAQPMAEAIEFARLAERSAEWASPHDRAIEPELARCASFIRPVLLLGGAVRKRDRDALHSE